MRGRIIPFAVLITLAAPAWLQAQEMTAERGQLYQVVSWEVDPADAQMFEKAVKGVAEAAVKSNLEYHWSFWQDGSQYTLVFPVGSFGYFDDPGQFERAFEGKPGQSQMKEAMAMFPKIKSTVVAEEIAELKPGWSYAAKDFNMNNMAYGHFDVMWLKSGMDAQFEQLNKDWVAAFKELGYPYPYDAHVIHFGDSGRVVYVTFVDNLSDFYGKNDIAKMIEAKGMGDRMAKLDEKFNTAVAKWKHYTAMYRRDMSYWPAPEQATK